MARPASFETQCINIRVHTKHAADEYEALWKMLGRQRMPIVWRSGMALMIGESHRREAPRTDGFFGHFYRFVQINPDDPWFDIAKHKPAEPEDLARVSIPVNLRPNLQQLPYYFDIIKHRLYFVTHASDVAVSAIAVKSLLQSLLLLAPVRERFGEVDVTIATETEAVEKLLQWPVLRKLTITLERPNPTDYEDEKNVFKHLNQIGAKVERREYVRADDRPTLRPDDEMQALAAVAGNNGLVEVTGKDHDGKSRSANSQEFAWKVRRTFPRKFKSLTEAFLEVVGEMFTRKL